MIQTESMGSNPPGRVMCGEPVLSNSVGEAWETGHIFVVARLPKSGLSNEKA